MADRWCAANQARRGEVVPVEQLWKLAQLWYHNRLALDFHGRTTAEAESIFDQMGLTSSFWHNEKEIDHSK